MINSQTIDQQIEKANKKSDELKTAQDNAQKLLDTATTNFDTAQLAQQNSQKKVTHANAVRELTASAENEELLELQAKVEKLKKDIDSATTPKQKKTLGSALKKKEEELEKLKSRVSKNKALYPTLQQVDNLVKELKDNNPNFREQAESTLKLMAEAKENSKLLKDHIAKVIEDEGIISADLITDATAADTSISKAWEHTTVAYKKSLTAIEDVLALQQALIKIDALLSEISSLKNLGVITSKFQTYANPLNIEAQKLEAVKEKKEKDLKIAEVNLKKQQDKIAKLAEKQEILESVNA